MNSFQRNALGYSLAQLGLPPRTINTIENRMPHVQTVEDLLQCKREDLLALPNFGDKTLEDIYTRLAEIGFLRGNIVVSGKTFKEKMIDRGVEAMEDIVGDAAARYWLLECSETT